ncbi:MAG: zinc-ribbon domain-containing protein [Candidatus Odinarchaeota archaeon]
MFLPLYLIYPSDPLASFVLRVYTEYQILIPYVIAVICWFGAVLTINRIQIKLALLFSMIGLIIATIGILMMLLWHIFGDDPAVIYPGFYVLLIAYIALWILTGYLVRYINITKCGRCGNLFKTDQIVKCHQCGRRICQNCLDKEYNVCTACRTDYRMKLEVAEKSKQQQTQSQQVIVQTSQIQPSQTSAPEVSSDMKHCIHCGSKIKRTAKFCEECGKEL